MITDLNEQLVFYVKGVVWDLDGTLLDSFRLMEDVLSEVLRYRNMAVPSHEVFARNYHGRLRDSIHAISGADGPVLDEIYEEFIRNEDHHYAHPDELYFVDALDLLRRNHATGIRQVIISNRPHYSDGRLGSPRNLAARPPLSGLIQATVCGDDSDFHKPDARVLDEVERALGLKRNELLVIGDQSVDAELAHNLRVPALLVSRDRSDIPRLDKDGVGIDHVTIVSDLSNVTINLPA